MAPEAARWHIHLTHTWYWGHRCGSWNTHTGGLWSLQMKRALKSRIIFMRAEKLSEFVSMLVVYADWGEDKMSKASSVWIQQINLQISKGLLINGRSSDRLLWGGEETESTCRLAQAEVASRSTPYTPYAHTNTRTQVQQAKPDWSWKICSREKKNHRERAFKGNSVFLELDAGELTSDPAEGHWDCADPVRSKEIQAQISIK